MTAAETTLTIHDTPLPALDSAALQALEPLGIQDLSQVRAVMERNMGEVVLRPFDFDRIRVPRSGNTTWAIEDLEGSHKTEEIEAVIVHWLPNRAYWETPFAGAAAGSPPDCRSTDLRNGDGAPGGVCSYRGRPVCPFAQFGSDTNGGRGSACRESRFLFLAQQGSLLPAVVQIPRTSLRNCTDYFKRLGARGIAYNHVLSSLTLTAEEINGFTVTVVNFRLARRFTPEECAVIDAYSEELAAFVQSADLIPEHEDEFSGNGHEVSY
jgi:hypothetical protein